jgi:hypothetical protein
MPDEGLQLLKASDCFCQRPDVSTGFRICCRSPGRDDDDQWRRGRTVRSVFQERLTAVPGQ